MLITPVSSRVRYRSTKSTLNLFNVLGYLTFGRWYNAKQDGDWWELYTGGYVRGDVVNVRPDAAPSAKPVYVSQWGLGANSRRNDCGYACVNMFLRARGINVTVDELRLPNADPSGLTSATQLRNLLLQYGITANIETLDPKLPMSAVHPYSILLVNYTPLRQYAQDTRFIGWHWLIGVGVAQDDPTLYSTLDPDYWSPRTNEGNGKRYPVTALRSAFRPYSGAYTTSLYVPDIV